MGLILGFVSAVCGIISSIATTIGPVITSAATALVAKLPMVALSAKIVMESISNVISKTAELLGIAPEEERHEELGAKAMQEETKQITEFETTQEYLDYLRKDVPLDKEKYAKMTDEEKVACSALGTTMVSRSIQEKTGVEIPPEFLITIYRARLDFDQVGKFINGFANNGIYSMGEMTKYISNELPEEKVSQIGGAIRESIKELSPAMSDEEIMQDIVDMKRAYDKEQP